MGIDKKELDKISKWFNNSNLTSATIEYTVEGNYTITMAKEQPIPHHCAPHPMGGSSPSPDNVIHTSESAPTESLSKETASNTQEVQSPIVGTFYRSPGPDSPPFVQVGDTVKKGDTLCIIEAMKVMNELEADFDMEIVNIVADNGQLVEYGQVVFEVNKL